MSAPLVELGFGPASKPIVVNPWLGRAPVSIRELWAYRELLYFLVWRDHKVRYKQTILGMRRSGGRPCADGSLEFELEIESDAARDVRSLAVCLTELYGTKVLNADTVHLGRTVALRAGRATVRFRIRAVHLMPGFCRVGLWLADPVKAPHVSGAYDFVEPVAPAAS